MNIHSNNLKVERKVKELFYKDKSRVQITKISQFGLMEISRQRIGQSIYETFYKKCECCDGNGFKKTKSIIINNIISNLKSIHAVDNKEDIDLIIDEEFLKENSKNLKDKIKSIELPFNVNLISKYLPKEIFEFDKELVIKIKNNTNEIIEMNKNEVTNIEKSYRRKIKKKTVDKTN